MIVLDTLKSDDPNLRRIGETWMRCSLKSYLRYESNATRLDVILSLFLQGSGSSSLRPLGPRITPITFSGEGQWQGTSRF